MQPDNPYGMHMRCHVCGALKQVPNIRLFLGETIKAVCRDCDAPRPPTKGKPKLRIVEKPSAA